eukprot:980126-Alexandrium_andersonii.AAC.1
MPSNIHAASPACEATDARRSTTASPLRRTTTKGWAWQHREGGIARVQTSAHLCGHLTLWPK